MDDHRSQRQGKEVKVVQYNIITAQATLVVLAKCPVHMATRLHRPGRVPRFQTAIDQTRRSGKAPGSGSEPALAAMLVHPLSFDL